MKNDIVSDRLPPVIRVFLSSTFADMENERTYFNEHLVPKLNRLCEERGVSFFSVDLRWGITEEEQISGKVLPICLREIDRCRPFFIGILGNRYGSLMQDVPLQISDSIPWLTGKEGKSITELEMLYAALEHDQGHDARNSAFFMRADSLSKAWYGESEVAENLLKLKDQIRSDGQIACSEYSNLEEFGASVMNVFQEWLDREFPLTENMDEVRRAWYNGELLRNYVHVSKMHSFLDSYISESNRPLMLYGSGARGKTTFLTSWEPKEGHKILINCGSDDLFLYWPSIAQEIIKQITDIQPDCDVPDVKARASIGFQMLDILKNKGKDDQPQRLSTNFFMVTDEDKEAFRMAFLEWLSNLSLDQPVYIIINDLNLLEDTNSRFLSWLPVYVNDSVHIVCSTNNDNMLENAEILGWNCKEMLTFPEESAREFILHYLQIYGKNLSDAQLNTLVNSHITVYPGQLRFMLDFLIDYGRFENLDKLIGDLSLINDSQAMYRYILDYIVANYSEKERMAIKVTFGLLRHAQMSLNEQECYRLTGQLEELSVIEWANVRSVFEQFNLIKGEYWNLREEELKKFVDGLLTASEHTKIHSILGEYFFEALLADNEFSLNLQKIREKTTFARSALIHFRLSENMERLTDALTNHQILFYLSKLDWQVVCESWMAVFLDSDIDIPEQLFALLERYKNASGDDRLIFNRIGSLFYDLDLRSHLEQVKQIFAGDYIEGSFAPDFRSFSSSFIEIYNELYAIKSRAEYRELNDRVNALLNSSDKYLPMELCSLYFFKADSEDHLKLYTDLLDTVNKYYKLSLIASSMYDLSSAISLRGVAYFRLGNYADAEQVQLQACSLALREGNVRAYLAAKNIIAMCQYHTNRYEESIHTFDELNSYWIKLGDKNESATIRMNKCNALYCNGDYQGALNEAEKLFRDISATDDIRMRQTRASVIGNMGYYSFKLKDYKNAEAYFIKSIREAESIKHESALLTSMRSLLDVYKETDQLMLALELSEKLMSFLWDRKQYKSLLTVLNGMINRLSENNYTSLASELRAHWESKFSQIPGGKDYLLNEFERSSSDEKKIDYLREQLALAKSESDTTKTAAVTTLLAKAILPSDRAACVEYLLDASMLYKTVGKVAEYRSNLTEAVSLLFNKGLIANEQLLSKAVSLINDSDILRIIDLWKQVGRGAQSSLPENQSFLSKLMKHKSSASQEAPYAESMVEISSYGSSCEDLVFSCLIDLIEALTTSCSAEQIIQVIHNLPEESAKGLILRIRSEMIRDSSQDISALTMDYESDSALKKLEYYEKFLKVMQIPEARALDTEGVASIAGNIAIIYRRKKDKSKTLHYHELALDIYKQLEMLHDYFIEMLNLSTAYKQFGQIDKAIEMLRSGIADTNKAKEYRLEASMVGNLAAYLTEMHDPSFNDEIIRCFDIEESYFRNNMMYRDLAISLFNQVLFYRSNSSFTRDSWIDKLNEIEQIAAKFKLSDMSQTVSALKRSLNMTSSGGSGNPNEQAARAKIQELLDTDSQYEIKKFSLESQGVYHAVCLPIKESETDNTNLHLYLHMGSSFRMDIMMLCQPRLNHKQLDENAERFVAWWNEQSIYKLVWRKENRILQAIATHEPSDWNEIVHYYKLMLKLFDADRACLQMINFGLGELQILKEFKTKVLTEL